MRIALTGTPGTGKTSVSKVLRDRGYDVLDMTQYIISPVPEHLGHGSLSCTGSTCQSYTHQISLR